MPESAPNLATNLATYMQYTALLLDLPLPTESQAAVLENLSRIQAIAAPVLEFPLPDDLEAAPVFLP